jgi:hypothetical protein
LAYCVSLFLEEHCFGEKKDYIPESYVALPRKEDIGNYA